MSHTCDVVYELTHKSFKVDYHPTPALPHSPFGLILDTADDSSLLYSSPPCLRFKLIIRPLFAAKKVEDVTVYHRSGNLTVKFTELGTHKVEVLLNGKDIVNSPFNVTVVPVVPQPQVRWYWRLKNAKIDTPFTPNVSALLEAYYQLKIESVRFKVNEKICTLNVCIRKGVMPGIIFDDEIILTRGTWFFVGDKNELLPYPESHATALEKGFILNPEPVQSVDVSDTDKKKIRKVEKTNTGYRQFRNAHDAVASGRAVYRGYEGRNIDFIQPVPLIYQFQNILYRGRSDPNCILHHISKEVYDKILGYAQQPEWDQYALLAKEKKYKTN